MAQNRAKVSAGTRCREEVKWVVWLSFEGPTAFDTAFPQNATCSFCRSNISITQSSLPKELWPEWPLKPKPSIARLPELLSPATVSSCPSPEPVRPVPWLPPCVQRPAKWPTTGWTQTSSQITMVHLASNCKFATQASIDSWSHLSNFNGVHTYLNDIWVPLFATSQTLFLV